MHVAKDTLNMIYITGASCLLPILGLVSKIIGFRHGAEIVDHLRLHIFVQ